MRRARAMLALVVALGVSGFVTLAALLVLSPGAPPAPAVEPLPLRSVAVLPFEAPGDLTLAPAALRIGEALANALAREMPHVRIVAGRAEGVRFRLEGNLRYADGEGLLELAVIDARDDRRAGHARFRVTRAVLREPDIAAREVAPTARRLVTAAMLSAAAQ